jgi:hypothetical protein
MIPTVPRSALEDLPHTDNFKSTRQATKKIARWKKWRRLVFWIQTPLYATLCFARSYTCHASDHQCDDTSLAEPHLTRMFRNKSRVAYSTLSQSDAEKAAPFLKRQQPKNTKHTHHSEQQRTPQARQQPHKDFVLYLIWTVDLYETALYARTSAI